MWSLVHKIFSTALFCFLIVLPIKIFASGSVNQEILDSNGKTPYATYNSCGGVIETKCDQTIILEYKPDEEYDNNEFCVWTIRNKECLGSLITKIKSGFEVGYDYIQISGFDDGDIGYGPSYTELMGSTSSMEQIGKQAYVNFLIFSTDNTNIGMGFRIEIVGWWPMSKPRWSDDFLSMSPSGTTSLIPYFENIYQSYVINPKLTTVSSLVLNIQYKMSSAADFFAIYSLERNGQSINFRPQSRRVSGNGTVTFEAEYYANFLAIFYVSRLFPVPEWTGYSLDWYPAKYHN